MITGNGFIAGHVQDQKDTIIHLDAITGINDCKNKPLATFMRNVSQTVTLLDQAKQEGKRFVFASSAAAADPTNPYAASKAASEAFCQAYREMGCHVSILRFGNVYGPGSLHKTSCVAMMCREAIKNKVIYVDGDGKQTRDLVYVRDVAEAIRLAPDGTWSVRTGEQVEIWKVAEIIAELSGAMVYYSGEPGGASSSVDNAPRVDIGYLDLRKGLELTYTWFCEQL